MKLGKGIVFHATEDAKKKYKEKKNTRKSSCPSCEIENIKRFIMKNDGEIDIIDDNDYINRR
jgi:hypothetical protein